METETERICKECNQSKPISDYYKHKQGRNGFNTRCKVCVRAKQNTPEMVEYRRRYYSQGTGPIPEFKGTCDICGKDIEGKNKHLDHDHKTGKNRGWLCHSCNVAIGLLRDDPEIVRKALAYISR